eukprot:gene10005-biopygen12686
MDFQLLSGMKVEELKAFLRLRGLKVSGRKEELVARAFVAMENNVPIVLTAEEVEIELAKQYTAKLNVFISDEVGIEEIPDPFKLTEDVAKYELDDSVAGDDDLGAITGGAALTSSLLGFLAGLS